ncbi:hypothetical protein RR48_09704 [Papilio machaon]|uniref:Uncharacterized protein n=1 Tax=Papilio machaon TaxID=76193 RepID=A0A194RIK8_PAPMA|nr:hypothetical protein RR48_09704 [Papilio machaon]
MVGRASVEPGWPVDPGRSAGPAPHRPPTAPRGGITRTRAPGSTRAGDRLTRVALLAASPARSPFAASPPRRDPTGRGTCLRRAADHALRHLDTSFIGTRTHTSRDTAPLRRYTATSATAATPATADTPASADTSHQSSALSCDYK